MKLLPLDPFVDSFISSGYHVRGFNVNSFPKFPESEDEEYDLMSVGLVFWF